MKKTIVKGILVTAGVVILLTVGVVAYLVLVEFGNADKTVAKNLSVTSEWTEIQIDPPVTPRYNHQAIYLRPTGFKVNVKDRNFDVKVSDGTRVQPEVEVYDDQGNRFQMRKVGFALSARGDYVEFWPESEPMPRNRKYMVVRIRSDVPFVCEQVKWIDYSPP